MKTFTFTAEQIKDIYRAGMRHGWADNWWSKEFDELIDAVYYIVNDGIEQEQQISYDTVEEWFK